MGPVHRITVRWFEMLSDSTNPNFPTQIAVGGAASNSARRVVGGIGSDRHLPPITLVTEKGIRRVGGWGFGPGEVVMPRALAFAGDTLVVLDVAKRVVVMFDSAGRQQGELRIPTQMKGSTVLGLGGVVLSALVRRGKLELKYWRRNGSVQSIFTDFSWRAHGEVSLIQPTEQQVLAFQDLDGCIASLSLSNGSAVLLGCLPIGLRERAASLASQVFAPVATKLRVANFPHIPYSFVGSWRGRWVFLRLTLPRHGEAWIMLDLQELEIDSVRFVSDGPDNGDGIPVALGGSGAAVVLLQWAASRRFRLGTLQ